MAFLYHNFSAVARFFSQLQRHIKKSDQNIGRIFQFNRSII